MKKIFVGLSGGVDSSVAAALLKEQGYDVTGIYMKNWTQDLPGMKCPWREDLNDARSVAAHLEIPFKVYDFREQYRHKVVEYMVDEYRAGRTPNPDIMCNQEVKFKLFLETALADGADMVATGHYARTNDGKLMMAADSNKDQTYFLSRVSSSALLRTVMPIGDYKKSEVRQLAKKLGLPTAAKKDSQGICFVGPVGLKAFLSSYMETSPGPILDKDGKKIGTHGGAIFFTTGQRSGLGVGGGRPFYVLGKDMGTNTVYVTDDPTDLEIEGQKIVLEDECWVGKKPEPDKRYYVRLRHRGDFAQCRVEGQEIILDSSVSAIAPGQSAVIYDGNECLGGGIIRSAKVKLPV